MPDISGNQRLLDHLIASGVLHSPSLIEAFRRQDRILFVPAELHPDAYDDAPLPIGGGQTISQPSTVAIMLELLCPRLGDKVLDLGSGSGWTTALLAEVVGKEGLVVGVERIPSLVECGRRNLSQAHVRNASVELADPAVIGKPGHLYDRILVSASAAEIPPSLLEQLKPGGILVVPVGSSVWRVMKKEDGSLDRHELPGFRFVPLILP